MTDSARRCLSVVVPCYNEEATILELLDRVAASPWVQEIVVVDDGSTDKSRTLLSELNHPMVRVHFQPRNMGKCAALRTGFSLVTGEYAVVQDADLEYSPDDYALLLAPLERGLADVVYGSRFQGAAAHRVLYFWHTVGNRFLTLLSNMMTDLNLTDMETCYKVFRRGIIQSITIEENRFGFEPEITAKVAKARWRVYEVGISYSGRTYDEGKKIGWKDGLRAFYCIVRYSPVGDRLARK